MTKTEWILLVCLFLWLWWDEAFVLVPGLFLALGSGETMW